MSKTTAIAILCLALFCMQAAGQEVKCELALAKGLKFEAKQTTDWSVTMEPQGAGHVKGEITRSFEVLDATAEKNFKIKATFGKVKLDLKLGIMEMEDALYDSDKEEDKAKLTHPVVARYALTGLTMVFVLSRDGKLVGEVEGLDKIRETIIGRFAGDENLAAEKEKAEAEDMKGRFRKEIENMFATPCVESKKAGDEWVLAKGKQSLPFMPDAILDERKLKLAKIEGDKAFFAETGKLAVDPEGDMSEFASFKNTKRSFKKETEFDVKTGICAKIGTEMEFAFEKPDQPPDGSEEMPDFKMEIKGRLVFEITKTEKP